MDHHIGRTLGPYELQERLGAGGMGIVYRALHRRLAQYRAVKVLPANLAEDPALVMRFEREARLAAELDHPNIVRLFDVNDHEGVHYLVMALLSGRSLQQVLLDDQPLPLDRVFRLLGQLGSALDFAHARGVVHRDVKPANAFVGDDDHVTLVDFGIAIAGQESRLTGVGQVIGTPEYLAPEVVTGQQAGPSADLYALGIIAYEMLAGRVPFTGMNSHAILLAQARDAPPPPRSFRPDLPASVQAVLLRQLEKAPENRFRTAGAFVSALAAASADAAPVHRTATTEPLAAPETEQPWRAGTPDAARPTPAPRPSGRISGPLPAPPLSPDGRGSGPLTRPSAGRDSASNTGPSSLVIILACVGVAVVIVLLGGVASLAMGGRDSPVARAVLGPLPTPTPLPTATLVPTPTLVPSATPVPTATSVPGPRLADLVGTWTAVSSNTNGGPATPETSLRLSFKLDGDRAMLMTRVDRSSDPPVRFDYQRTDGQSLIGSGSSNGQVAEMSILVAEGGRQITMTLRPAQASNPATPVPRDTYGLTLRRD